MLLLGIPTYPQYISNIFWTIWIIIKFSITQVEASKIYICDCMRTVE
jgi:hypothetical protein